ncbi:hypothetical protein [Mycolicibacterium fortuitum]|uniref:hypothetical protein n=1 Tax=Mycolicibacterium fortuitum TaxID=1766 RepID=UPI001CE1E6C9|nr:hypothetical protein [Mycolicibacterium fortuitum]MCA4727144.1 hypothetical protein [Mycolicibacterium fortuitum]
MGKQLPSANVVAAQWAAVATALKPAYDGWLAVSPESIGPVEELLRHARWNALVFDQLARGVSRPDAWRAADAEIGRAEGGFINYEPDVSDD